MPKEVELGTRGSSRDVGVISQSFYYWEACSMYVYTAVSLRTRCLRVWLHARLFQGTVKNGHRGRWKFTYISEVAFSWTHKRVICVWTPKTTTKKKCQRRKCQRVIERSNGLRCLYPWKKNGRNVGNAVDKQAWRKMADLNKEHTSFRLDAS